jgi:hypothetical protein
MAVDMEEELLNKRDVTRTRLAALVEEMEKRATKQATPHAERELLRKRFQPGRLIAPASTDRFRFD